MIAGLFRTGLAAPEREVVMTGGKSDRGCMGQHNGCGAEGDRGMKATPHERNTDVPRTDLYHAAARSPRRRHRAAIRDRQAQRRASFSTNTLPRMAPSFSPTLVGWAPRASSRSG